MKITLEQQKSGRSLYSNIVQSAWKDKAFKDQLIKEPKKTIENIKGVEYSFLDDINIVVEDQTNSDIIYLNIPRKIDLDDLELTDEQLKLVSGGNIVYDFFYQWGYHLAQCSYTPQLA